MNCPVNYEDPTEEEAIEAKRTQPISALKTITWKSDVASPPKTPQECGGQDGSCMVRMNTHPVKRLGSRMVRMNTHPVKRLGMD